jgi:hypothetical protein
MPRKKEPAFAKAWAGEGRRLRDSKTPHTVLIFNILCGFYFLPAEILSTF